METKDTKEALLGELESITGLLDDDDDIPMLLDDEDDIPILGADKEEDIPLLNDTEEDIPLLADVDDDELDLDDHSLKAALSELESMELAPKSQKTKLNEQPEPEPKIISNPADTMQAMAQRISTARNKAHKNKTKKSAPGESLMAQIQNNAAEPIIKPLQNTNAEKENPFLSNSTKDRLESSKRLTQESLHSAIKKADETAPNSSHQSSSEVSNKPQVQPKDELIAFTASEATELIINSETTIDNQKEEDYDEDGSEALLDILDEDDSSTPPETIPNTPVEEKPLSMADIDQMVEEVTEEYMPIFEAALKKKLKEKLTNLIANEKS